MVALLSAFRLLAWRRCHADDCSLRILSPGKCQPTLKKQSACQKLRLTNTAWKLLAEWGIRRFMEAMARAVDTQTCQSVGTLSIGLDEARNAIYLRGKADMRYMTDLGVAGHFLMLRFWSQGITPCFAGAEVCLGPTVFWGQRHA
jgi:hypothetical protein